MTNVLVPEFTAPTSLVPLSWGTRRRLTWIAQRTSAPRKIVLAAGELLVVAGDVHLDPERMETVERFRAFLRGMADDTTGESRVRAFVCLGDLFEYYVGPTQLQGCLAEVVADLRNLVECGIDVAIVPGNRDFLIGREFEKEGIAVYPHGLRLDLIGMAQSAGAAAVDEARVDTALWILHGDELMLQSPLHRAWSRFSRSGLAQALARVLPVWLLERLARRMRMQSRRRRAQRQEREALQDQCTGTGEHLPRVAPEVAQALLASLAVSYPPADIVPRTLMTGHFHVPLIERGPDGTLMTLGEWDRNGAVVACVECARDDGTISVLPAHSSKWETSTL